jgi:membrane fusion protein (multidrug efflux system)
MQTERKANGWMMLGVACLTLTGPACKPKPRPTTIPDVSVQVIAPERATLTTELTGRTSPFLVAEIRPQVSGLIQQRLFQEGSDVQAESVLYQIDPAPYQAALDQAQASLAAAEAGLPSVRSRAERMKILVASRAVGEQDAQDAEAAYQKALAAVASAKASVASARFNLTNTPIKSPISGRIGMSTVTVGALVTAYQPASLATVQQFNPIYVDVTQSSSDLLKLRRSMENGRLKNEGTKKVKLLLEDGTTYPLEGRLQFRDVSVDPATGTVTLRIVFPNPKQMLLPGMFVRAIVEDGVDEKAILAMQQGITRDPKGNAIALVLDAADKVEQRTLSVDRAIGSTWLITGGLAAGDRLIVEGGQKVRPGMTVKAVPFTPGTAAEKK